MKASPRLLFRRRRGGYFAREESAPPPVAVQIQRRVSFNETDVMGIVWHGNYLRYFEEASAELGRKCGLSYQDYGEARVYAPVVQLHVDYHGPVMLEESIVVEARYVWCEGAKLHTEFFIYTANRSIAVTGYTIQMFVDASSRAILLATPEILEKCRQRWQAGEFR